MEERCGWIFTALVILSVLFWRDHHKLTTQVQTLQDEVYESNNEANACSDALDQANSNINDARGYAWSSYNDMGDALDSLETVEP